MGGPRGSLWERFWPKVDMSGGVDACWPWTGAKSKKRKHGQPANRRGHIREGGAGTPHRYAHVVALALSTDGEFVKWDPQTGARLEACHTCHAPYGDCCNPRHLYWGTQEQNRADRYGRPDAAADPGGRATPAAP